jgi:hypothetical protein
MAAAIAVVAMIATAGAGCGDPSGDGDGGGRTVGTAGGTDTTGPLVTSTAVTVAPAPTSSTGVAGTTGWARLPDPPLGGRTGTVTAAIGDLVLVVGGSTFLCPPNADCAAPELPPFRDGAALDLRTGTWRAIADAPIGIVHGAAAVVGDDLYVLQHCVDEPSCVGGTAPAFVRYRPADDAWDTLPSPPAAGFFGLAAVAETVVAYRGSDERGETPDHAFDPATSTWATLPDDPLPGVYDRQVVDVGGRLLVFGAALESSGSPTVLVASLDRATGTWTELAGSGTLGYQAWPVGGLVYLNPHVSGAGGGVFDPVAGTWADLPAAPDGRPWRGDMTGVVGAGEGHFEDAGGWVLDATTDTWLEIAVRPGGEGVSDDARTAVGRRLFVFGGQRWADGAAAGELVDEAWTWTPPGPSPPRFG